MKKDKANTTDKIAPNNACIVYGFRFNLVINKEKIISKNRKNNKILITNINPKNRKIEVKETNIPTIKDIRNVIFQDLIYLDLKSV
ncbi:MAG: hypothetical protein ACXWEY_16435 [Bacteroidia bacterium]